MTYLHGHSVGGTNPSLLRAIGAGAAVIAFDVDFNREVLGGAGRYFATADDVAALVDDAEAEPRRIRAAGKRAREWPRGYDWDDVAAGYEELALGSPAAIPKPAAVGPADAGSSARAAADPGAAGGTGSRRGRRGCRSPFPRGAAVSRGDVEPGRDEALSPGREGGALWRSSPRIRRVPRVGCRQSGVRACWR